MTSRERLARVFTDRAAARVLELLDGGRPVRILVAVERDKGGMLRVEIQPPKEYFPAVSLP